MDRNARLDQAEWQAPSGVLQQFQRCLPAAAGTPIPAWGFPHLAEQSRVGVQKVAALQAVTSSSQGMGISLLLVAGAPQGVGGQHLPQGQGGQEGFEPL